MTDFDQGDCAVGECDRPVEKSGAELCSLHRKRRDRGLDLHAPPASEQLPAFERVVKLAAALADCSSEDDRDFDRAREALRKGVEKWSRSLLAARGGRARLSAMTAQQRIEFARLGAARRVAGQTSERRSKIARIAAQARAAALSPWRRQEIARQGARARHLLASSPGGSQASACSLEKRQGEP